MLEIEKSQEMAGSARRADHGLPRIGALLIACALSFCASACAHHVADAPSLQWRLDTAESTTDTAVEITPSSACGGAGQSGWSEHCFVYRSGDEADPDLALAQM